MLTRLNETSFNHEASLSPVLITTNLRAASIGLSDAVSYETLAEKLAGAPIIERNTPDPNARRRQSGDGTVRGGG